MDAVDPRLADLEDWVRDLTSGTTVGCPVSELERLIAEVVGELAREQRGDGTQLCGQALDALAVLGSRPPAESMSELWAEIAALVRALEGAAWVEDLDVEDQIDARVAAMLGIDALLHRVWTRAALGSELPLDWAGWLVRAGRSALSGLESADADAVIDRVEPLVVERGSADDPLGACLWYPVLSPELSLHLPASRDPLRPGVRAGFGLVLSLKTGWVRPQGTEWRSPSTESLGGRGVGFQVGRLVPATADGGMAGWRGTPVVIEFDVSEAGLFLVAFEPLHWVRLVDQSGTRWEHGALVKDERQQIPGDLRGMDGLFVSGLQIEWLTWARS